MLERTENYRQTLLGLKKKLLASRFLRWWLGELSSLVPSQMRSPSLDAESLTLVHHDESVVLLRRFQNGQLRDADSLMLQTLDPAGQRELFLAALDKAGAGLRDVVLTLPRDRILRKTLTLPLATEENLRQVLEFQMEEHTPFPASRLYFGYRVTGRDFDRGQLAVEFVATPRDGVDASVKALNDWGATVRAVVAEDAGQARAIYQQIVADAATQRAERERIMESMQRLIFQSATSPAPSASAFQPSASKAFSAMEAYIRSDSEPIGEAAPPKPKPLQD